LTGNWEARLARIARGQETRGAFMGDIASYVQEVVAAIRAAAPMVNVPLAAQMRPGRRLEAGGKRRPRKAKAAAKTAATPPAPAAGTGIADLRCPACGQGQVITGKRGWGCSRWREGCKFVVWFEENGKRRSEADLRAIVASGRPHP
jgi:DNA topoisomerase-3